MNGIKLISKKNKEKTIKRINIENLEEFNDLDNQATNPWSNQKIDDYDIFQNTNNLELVCPKDKNVSPDKTLPQAEHTDEPLNNNNNQNKEDKFEEFTADFIMANTFEFKKEKKLGNKRKRNEEETPQKKYLEKKKDKIFIIKKVCNKLSNINKISSSLKPFYSKSLFISKNENSNPPTFKKDVFKITKFTKLKRLKSPDEKNYRIYKNP